MAGGCSSVMNYLCGEVRDFVSSIVKNKQNKTFHRLFSHLRIFTILKDIPFLLTLSTEILYKHILVSVDFDCSSIHS